MKIQLKKLFNNEIGEKKQAETTEKMIEKEKENEINE